MIGKEQWYSAPDDTIESWCFLVLDPASNEDTPWIKGWELAVGNSTQILRRESDSIGEQSSEADLIAALFDELDDRRYDDTMIITPRRTTLALLRTRLVENDDCEETTLRGFRHLAIHGLFEEYFWRETEINRSHGDESIQERLSLDALPESIEAGEEQNSAVYLHHLLNQIGPLVPHSELTGRVL